jgi:hypothetical protein
VRDDQGFIPLGAQTSALRNAILHRYALLGPGGGLSRCQSSPARKAKVIFPTRRAALRAEEELAQVGALRQSVYPCGEHFHLTKLRLGPEVQE